MGIPKVEIMISTKNHTNIKDFYILKITVPILNMKRATIY